MDHKPGRRSSLFLFELMISILFFSIAAAVCVLLFVKSHTLETRSIQINHAVHACTSVAEIFRSQEDPLSLLSETYPDGQILENGYHIYYSDDWTPCSSGKEEYVLKLDIKYNDMLSIANIEAQDAKTVLYSLTVKKHLPVEVTGL